MIIIGIDPGQKGAVVALTEDRTPYSIAVMKDSCWFADHISELQKEASLKVYLERAQAMPSNGAVSMFNYGKHYGELMGVLVALCVPFETVPPTVWTKEIHRTRSKNENPKARAVDAARRLYPGQCLTDPDSTRATVPHTGIVDALLIAEYGRRKCLMK